MNKEKESTWLCQRHQEFDVGFMCCLVTKNSTAGESLTLNSSFSVNAGKSLTFEQLSTRRSNLSTLFLSNCWTSLLSEARQFSFLFVWPYIYFHTPLSQKYVLFLYGTYVFHENLNILFWIMGQKFQHFPRP